MCLIRVIVLFSVFVFNFGFLLEDKIPQQTSTSNQFPSISKYLADQTSIHHELETLRRHQEMEMRLLTSQLMQRLAEMETKCSEQLSRNDTCRGCFEEFEQNFQDVKQTNSRLAVDLEVLQFKYNLLNKAFENSTTELKSSLQELKKMKNIQQLQSLNNLQETVQKIDLSVTTLKGNEQARSQDFLALYNITMRSEVAISRVSTMVNKYQTDLQNVDKEMNNTNTELQRVSIQMNQYQTDLQNVDKEMNNTNTELQRVSCKMNQYQTDLQNVDKEMNNTNTELQRVSSKMNQYQTDLQNVDKEMNNTNTELQRVSSKMNQYQTDLQNVDKELNNTITELQQNIANKVALTACVDTHINFSPDQAIQFTDVRTAIGFDSNGFRTTGQFVCTVSDLYHISVVLMSLSKNIQIKILKNNQQMVTSWIDNYDTTSSGTHYYRSAVAVTTTWLHVGDTVKVTGDPSAKYEGFQSSCFTIVRIS